MPLALSLRDVSRTYVAGIDGCLVRVRALDRVDLDVACGEVVELIGGAGAGKSTLLLCAARLLLPDRGRVAWPAAERGRSGTPTPDYCAHIGATLCTRDDARAARAKLSTPSVRLALLDLEAVAGSATSAFDRELVEDLLGDLSLRGVAALVAGRTAACAMATRRLAMTSGRIVHDVATGQRAVHNVRALPHTRSVAARVAERAPVDGNSIDPDSSHV